MLPTSRTTGHLLYAKGSPSPSSCSWAEAWQRGSAHSQCHTSWGLVEPGFVKRLGNRSWRSLGRGWRDLCLHSISQTFLLGLGLFFLLLHCLVSLSQAAMGSSPFTRSVSKERPNFPRGEAPTCCHPSCSHWLQQEIAMLRSAGAQAIVLLPTTTACAASRRCRRCRARFCTNPG